MIKNFSLSLKRPVFRLALVGTIAVLMLGALAPEALGASSPTPTPKKSQTNPTPTPRVNEQGQKEPKEKVKVGQAPKIDTSLNARTRQALRSFNAASLAIQNCDQIISGTPPTCGFDLWARVGAISTSAAPGLSSAMPIWGFTLDNEGPGRVPGPTLIVRQGQQLRIRLHNVLPSSAGNLSLEIPAANVAPDLDGIARNAATTYNFGLLEPGTYLYQAGPTPNAPRQILMGLSGLLIVRPNGYTAANTSAYGTDTSQFQAEATLQINEFDSTFNRDPFGVDPNDYSPNVFLVNGRAFSSNGGGGGENGNTIEVLAGDTLLLHYANLGNHDRGFSVLNHRQVTLTDDSSRNFANPLGIGQFLQKPTNVATKWLTPGQVADTFVTVDPGYSDGTRIPIFESGFHLADADGTSGLGGMMTYLRVHALNGSVNGPVTTVAIGTTAGFTGMESLTFSGSMTSTGSVTGIEWFLDTLTVPGTGRKFDTTDCDVSRSLTGGGRTFSCTLSAARLNSIVGAPTNGDHVVWVHGQNGAGGWGAVSGDVFTYNISGPETGAMTVHLTPTNGYRINDIANGAGPGKTYLPTSDLVLLGTSTQSLADWTVLKGEYCLDSTSCANGAGTGVYLTPPMTAALATQLTSPLTSGLTYTSISVQSTTVAIVDGSTLTIGSGTTTQDVITVGNRPVGSTSIAVASFTAAANFGSGTPVAGTVLAGPNPAGTACASADVDYGTPGNGNTLPDAPGGAAIVAWCGFVPTAVLNAKKTDGSGDYVLGEGTHTLFAHAYEAPNGTTTGGRWGSYGLPGASIQFAIDRTGPGSSNLIIDPSPNNGQSSQSGNLNFLDSLQLQANLLDSASNIAGAEAFVTDTSKSPANAADAALFTTGTGAEMIPAGAVWGDAPGKQAYAYVPLAVLTTYPDGLVRFWVHAQDVAGNWGPFAYTDLTLDRKTPVLTAVAPTTIGSNVGACRNATPCVIHFSATDPGPVNTNIVSGEWYLGQNIVRLPGDDIATSNDPGFGKGIPFSIATPANGSFQITTSLIMQYLIAINATAATLPAGTSINIVFRVRDAAGNWSNSTYVVGTA